MNRTPFQQCCFDLSNNHMPNWQVWKGLNKKKQHILKEVMLEENHAPIVLAYLEEFTPSKTFREFALNRYAFPKNVTLEQLDHLSNLTFHVSDARKGKMFDILMHTCLSHNRPDIAEWMTKQPFMQSLGKYRGEGVGGDMLTLYVPKAHKNGQMELGKQFLHMAQQIFEIDVSVVRKIYPEVWAEYEKDVLLAHVQEGRPTQPKVM